MTTTTDLQAALPHIELANDDLERCLVHSRMEIVSILEALRKATTLVTAYVGGAQDFILTTVLAVDPQNNQLVIEFGSDAAANARALQVGRMKLAGVQERVSIQFVAEEVRKITHGGRDAFVTPIPKTLVRLQRREYFRVTPPRMQPLSCILGDALIDAGAPRMLKIVDISCGGIGVLHPTQAPGLELGERLRGCRIVLPESPAITTDMQVRNRFDQLAEGGNGQTRAGWEFVGLAERDRTPIQRYINKIERERSNRS